MARRKHHKKTTKRRSRKGGIHGIGGGLKGAAPVLIQIAEGVAGAIAGSFVTNKFLDNVGGADKPNMKHLIVLGGSAAAVMFVKNPHVKNIAIGAGSYAGLQLAKTAIPGIGDLMIGEVDTIMENLMIGAAPGGEEEYPLLSGNESLILENTSDAVILEDTNY